jgi:hypothetical protein
MDGSTNAQQMQALVNAANTAGIVTQDRVSGFSIGRATVPLHAPFTLEQMQIVQSALVNANHAMALTGLKAEVATPSTMSSKTITSKITSLSTDVTDGLNVITDVAGLIRNVPILEAGATATLHWWGWTLELTEPATNALVEILGTGAKGLVAVAAALAPASAGLAAVLAIVPVALGALPGLITPKDKGKGVTINFYAWVAPVVTSN